jgi:hypothetical protein
VNQISPIRQISCMRQYRTIWISDIHLGTRGCKADFLVDFLRYNDADTIYLVGDIIDGWRLKRSWCWPQTHNDVIQKVLRKVRKGTRVIYVPGNHDEWLRDYTLLQFGGVEVADEVIHLTADGRRLLVLAVSGPRSRASLTHSAGPEWPDTPEGCLKSVPALLPGERDRKDRALSSWLSEASRRDGALAPVARCGPGDPPGEARGRPICGIARLVGRYPTGL